MLIVLDTTLVWLLVRNSNHPLVRQARAWAAKRKSEGHEFAVAEINDYETRRELLRKNAQAQVQRLDALLAQLEFMPLDRQAMLYAAQLWAQLRIKHQQTASDDALDGDVILGAQAILRSSRTGTTTQVVVATANVKHLSRICTTPQCTATDWTTM